MAIKYGGPREPFLSQLLRIQKIYGVIRRKEDNKPVQGMMLRINKPEIKVLSDANANSSSIYIISFMINSISRYAIQPSSTTSFRLRQLNSSLKKTGVL